jgi:hypothetical protein
MWREIYKVSGVQRVERLALASYLLLMRSHERTALSLL